MKTTIAVFKRVFAKHRAAREGAGGLDEDLGAQEVEVEVRVARPKTGAAPNPLTINDVKRLGASAAAERARKNVAKRKQGTAEGGATWTPEDEEQFSTEASRTHYGAYVKLRTVELGKDQDNNADKVRIVTEREFADFLQSPRVTEAKSAWKPFTEMDRDMKQTVIASLWPGLKERAEELRIEEQLTQRAKSFQGYNEEAAAARYLKSMKAEEAKKPASEQRTEEQLREASATKAEGVRGDFIKKVAGEMARREIEKHGALTPLETSKIEKEAAAKFEKLVQLFHNFEIAAIANPASEGFNPRGEHGDEKQRQMAFDRFYKESKELFDSLGVSKADGETMLWSNMGIGGAVANDKGLRDAVIGDSAERQAIGQTPLGELLLNVALTVDSEPMGWAANINGWKATSRDFAAQAKGEVHVFLPDGIAQTSVFMNVELPELRKNFRAVTKITCHYLTPGALQAFKGERDEARKRDLLGDKANWIATPVDATPLVPLETTKAQKMSFDEAEDKAKREVQKVLHDMLTGEVAELMESRQTRDLATLKPVYENAKRRTGVLQASVTRLEKDRPVKHDKMDELQRLLDRFKAEVENLGNRIQDANA